MTISLSNAGQRFESTFKTDYGLPFPAVIMPLDEGSVPSYDFSVPRHILRLRLSSPVGTGAIILDKAGNRYLVADHDDAIADNIVLYKTRRLFRLNKQVKWEREHTITDPLTQMKKGAGRVLVSMLWIMDEIIQREDIDLAFRVKEQSRKVITGSNVRVNDIIDDSVVTRVDEVMGVNMLEIR